MRFSTPIFYSIGMLAFSCTQQLAPVTAKSSNSIAFQVVEAPEWDSLFYQTSGWVGGDGIYSILLTDTANSSTGTTDTVTLFLFSDTVLGEIENDTFSNGFRMINNSAAVLKGRLPQKEKLHFYWNKKRDGSPASVFTPQEIISKNTGYFWLGAGFVNPVKQNNIYLFAYRIQNTAAKVFGFEEVGNTLLVIPANAKPPFEKVRQLHTPLFFQKDSSYLGSVGAGLLLNTKAAGSTRPDGYLYAYGVLGLKKEVVVARVKPGHIEEWNQWRFWNGKAWSEKKDDTKPIAERASNELSITPLFDGRYVMIFQVDGISNTIGMRIGSSPAGPFGPIIPIWDCSPVTRSNKNFFAYNAKAHPALSNKGELLISYNVNSFDAMNDLKAHPNHYRPRFIKVIWR